MGTSLAFDFFICLLNSRHPTWTATPDIYYLLRPLNNQRYVRVKLSSIAESIITPQSYSTAILGILSSNMVPEYYDKVLVSSDI